MKYIIQIIRTVALLIFSFLTIPFLASGQQKRKLTPEDYKLWDKSSKIKGGQVSEDGQWVYYSIKTEREDSVFVRNVINGKQFGLSIKPNVRAAGSIPIDEASVFSGNSRWFAITDGDSIRLMELKSGKMKSLTGTGFVFIPGTDQILVARKDSLISSFILNNLKTEASQLFADVVSYQFNHDLSKMVIATDSEGISRVHVIELGGKRRSWLIASVPQTVFNAFKWNRTGDVIAFIGRPTQSKLNKAEHTVYISDVSADRPRNKSFVPAELMAVDNQKKGTIFQLYLTVDGKQLFFSVGETKYPEPGNIVAKDAAPRAVQIWGASAQSLPPKDEKYNRSFWYVWHQDGMLETITNEAYPFAFVSGDEQKVMVYNKRKYLPQFRFVNSYADIYLKQRRTDSLRLLVPKVKDQPREFMTSPTGRYIGYFKENNWWVYDFEKDTHTCITQGMNRDWSNNQRTSTGTLPPHGSPGWLDDDQAIIVYDKNDIWLISADGKSRKQITNGQKDNITFRLEEKKRELGRPGGGNQWFSSTAYSGKDGLLITSQDYDIIENGWWWWTREKGLEKIITKEKKIDFIYKPRRGKPFLFTEQDFDLSPRLVLKHPSGKEEIIYQTNPQQKNYYWGRSKVINYTTKDGKTLSGALMFPANYDSTKKYPMVVEVYETRAKEVHYYIEPSQSNDKSNYTINPTVYTAEGYFVLLPDITYRLNEPGISAVECITAAVKVAVEKYGVNKNKIGITGNSFGGYETAFIISQTDLFAAAIAGAGITDVPDFYLGMSAYGTNLTRVEEDQFRMNVPFYSEPYNRNSPMHHIEKIKTPILLYTGDEDTNVDWTQSRKFQIAMWRLGKKSAMLVYPGENHALHQPKNILDLATRMKDWFDYYLKGDAPAEWIKTHMGIADK